MGTNGIGCTEWERDFDPKTEQPYRRSDAITPTPKRDEVEALALARQMSEERFYNALHRIAKDYQTPEQLRRNCLKQYGLDYEECLEMVYENLQQEAAVAIKGYRRPKVKTK